MAFIPTAFPYFGKPVEVKNKTILYQDTVLNLKDLGENIRVSSLYVVEDELQKCLEIVLKNNSDVVFNTIQYSKNDKKVFFYTNKELDFDAWYDKDKKVVETIDNTSDIINKIEASFKNEYTQDCISLKKYIDITFSYYDKLNKLESEFEKKIKFKLNAFSVSITAHEDGVMHIYINEMGSKGVGYDFKLINDDVVVIKTEGDAKSNIIQLIGTEVEELLTKYKKFYDLEVLFNGFDAGIYYIHRTQMCSDASVSLAYYKDIDEKLRIRFNNEQSNKYEIECNSHKVSEYLNKNMDRILNEVMIPISKTPIYVQKELIMEKERQERLEEQIRLETLRKKEKEERLAEEARIKYEEKEAKKEKYIPFYKYFKNKKKDNK